MAKEQSVGMKWVMVWSIIQDLEIQNVQTLWVLIVPRQQIKPQTRNKVKADYGGESQCLGGGLHSPSAPSWCLIADFNMDPDMDSISALTCCAEHTSHSGGPPTPGRLRRRRTAHSSPRGHA